MPDDDIDPRVTRTHRVVLDAAVGLLCDEGYGGFTVDGVVSRSGVAKTTIYRHWPTKSALLSAAIACFDDEEVPSPDTGSLRTDLMVLLKYLAQELAAAQWSKSLPAMIEGAEHDPVLGAQMGAIFGAKSAPLRNAIERAKRRGELRAGIDAEIVFAQLAGPLFFRRLLPHDQTTIRQVQKLIDQALSGILEDTARGCAVDGTA